MKKTILLLPVCLASINSYPQADHKKFLETLSSLTDQFDNSFSSTSFKDSLVVIYVSGLEDPISMAYDKLKGKKIINPQQVLIVGGFSNMQGETAAKINHLKMGFTSRYGTDYPKILLDADAKIGEMLPASGLAIIILKNGSSKVEFTDYGTKRKIFFDAINKYFN